jgi:hypothetical protein
MSIPTEESTLVASRATPNASRNAEIVRRRQSGEWPAQITMAMGISRNVVAGALNRAGLGDPNVDRKACARRGEDHPRATITEALARQILAMLPTGRKALQGEILAIARHFGVRVSIVRNLRRGITWAYLLPDGPLEAQALAPQPHGLTK